ncbi:hypothetical protein ABH927_006476 [Planotetraspora sp. GP83]
MTKGKELPYCLGDRSSAAHDWPLGAFRRNRITYPQVKAWEIS